MTMLNFSYLIPREELTFDMVEDSMISREVNSKPSLDEVIAYKDKLRVVTDITDVENFKDFYVLKNGYDFGNSFKGYASYSSEELIEIFLDSERWLHNNPDAQEVSGDYVFEFNGIDEEIGFADQNALSPIATFTMFFWVKVLDWVNPVSFDYIFSKETGVARSFGMYHQYWNNRMALLYSDDGTTFKRKEANASNAPINDTWCLLGYQFSSASALTYRMNELKETWAITEASLFNSSNVLKIGGNPDNSAHRFGGEMGVMGRVSKVLNDSEWAQLISLGHVGDLSSVSFYDDIDWYFRGAKDLNVLNGVITDHKGNYDGSFTNVSSDNKVSV